MAISFTCTCGKTMKVRDEYAGSPVKCSGCKATVKVPIPGATASSHNSQIAQAIASEPSQPWYYGFMVGMGLLRFICALLQFIAFGLMYFAQGGTQAEGMPLAYVLVSGATFLGAMLSYAVALVLADIGRNVRQANRQP